MPKRRRSDGPRHQTPEALEKRAARRAARERQIAAQQAANEERTAAAQAKIRRERAQVVTSFVQRRRICGVLSTEGMDSQAMIELMDGFRQNHAGKDGDEAGQRLLLVPAEGTVQGDHDEEFAQDVLRQISSHRHAHTGDGVLGFEGLDFSGQSGRGTPAFMNRMDELIAAYRRQPGSELSLVAFGTGSASDVSGAQDFNHALDRGFAGEFDVVLGLDARGEPLTVLEMETATYQPLAPVLGPQAVPPTGHHF